VPCPVEGKLPSFQLGIEPIPSTRSLFISALSSARRSI
jgi:hypothetical protein